jgi:meiotic recombination protein DMC1
LPRAQGGGQGKVLFIDTENTFRPERIKAIAERYDLDPEQVLSNIMVGRAFTVDALINLLMQGASVMVEDCFSLLIVDSIMAPFRVDYSGRGELAERQQCLAKVLSKLQKISEQFNVAVFLTNQVTADPGGGMTYAVDPKKPVGGNILAHASTTRLFLRKGKGDQRVCKIYDSPTIPESECLFQLSEGGVTDATD